MTKIPYPRLFSADMQPAESIRPAKLSITFNYNTAHTATMVVPFDADKLTMHSWIRLSNIKGDAGFFRVTGESETPGKERQITLRGAIDVLNDFAWSEQTDFTGTRREYIEKLLSFQKPVFFILGDMDEADEAFEKKNVNFARLSDLLTEFLSLKSDFYPAYDFSVFPWRLHLKKLPDKVSAELRLRRNLTNNVRILRDDKNQCTRLYLTVTGGEEEEIRTYNDTAAQAAYGVIEKNAEIDLSTVPDVDAWVKQYFSEYAKPYISISAPAVELYAQTGEAWDEFSVGKLARVALPAYGETYIERVSSVTYADVYAQPTAVTVQLANPLKSLTETMKDLRDLAASNANALGNAQKDLTYWEMIVKDIRLALDQTGIEELWKSGIILDAHSGVKIFSIYEGLAALNSQLIVNNEAISLRVMKNGVIGAINLSSEEARISANKIILDGYVSASEFEARVAEIKLQDSLRISTDQLYAERSQMGEINVTDFYFGSAHMSLASIRMGDITTEKVMYAPGSGSMDLSHSHAVSVDENGKVTLGEVSATGGNFSIADTQYYKNGVSAAYNRGYAAGSAAGNNAYNEGYSTGYAAGWVAAAAMVSTSRSGNRITVRRPSTIVDTPGDSTTFTITAGGAINDIRNTAANTFFAEGGAYAYVSTNGSTPVQVASQTLTKSQTINVGQ